MTAITVDARRALKSESRQKRRDQPLERTGAMKVAAWNVRNIKLGADTLSHQRDRPHRDPGHFGRRRSEADVGDYPPRSVGALQRFEDFKEN